MFRNKGLLLRSM